MEHAAPLEAVRPWRTAAIVASGVAALELVVLIVGGAALLGRPFLTHAAKAAAKPTPKSAPTKSKVEPARALLARTRTSVVVLNGNGRSGAAHAEAARVSARGYRISAVGNAGSANNGPTLVMYRPGFAAEAKRLARDLGISVVGALDGLSPSSLHGAKLVVVLGY